MFLLLNRFLVIGERRKNHSISIAYAVRGQKMPLSLIIGNLCGGRVGYDEMKRESESDIIKQYTLLNQERGSTYE